MNDSADAAGKFNQIVATEGVRRQGAILDQADADAERAREFAKAAQDPTSALYRSFGPDRLLSAGQIFATLATRG